jgi:hypothetical protein
MFSQSQITYDLVAQRIDELALQAVASDARRQARAAPKSGKFRLLVGEVLISTGQWVQGRKLHGYSPLTSDGGEI